MRPDPARVSCAVQAGDRAARSQSDRQDPRQPYVDRVLNLDPEAAAVQLADVLEVSRAGTATCWKRSRPGPTKWSRRCWRTARFPKYSASGSAPTSCTSIPSSLGAVQSQHRAAPRPVGTPEGRLRLAPSLRPLAKARLVPHLPRRSHCGRRQRDRRSDGPARLHSQHHVSDARPIGEAVEFVFKQTTDISERVIFPVTHSQPNGIEDARFVQFSEAARRSIMRPIPPTRAERSDPS